jgi:hypothetical protein
MSVPLRRPALGALAAGLLAVLWPAAPARATPRPLPFTYIYETLPRGDAEIELYTDLTPLRAYQPDGSYGTHLASQFQAEIEYGLTDRLELGLYLTLAPADGNLGAQIAMPEGTGIKQRLRYRFADAGQWPVDLAVYGEATENQSEIELEGKIILQRRLGPLRLVANAWGARELYFAGRREWELNPAAGVVLERWIGVQPGIEYWMHAEIADGALVLGPEQYLGPTVLLQFGKLWWSTGVYVHANRPSAPRDDTGNPYLGPVWIRSVVGISY